MSEKKEYSLLVNKKRIPVTEEIYKVYYRCKEREAYLDKLAAQNNLSIEECEEKGIRIDYIMSQTQESTEDKLIREELLVKLSAAVELLSELERRLIYSLFFKRMSESQFAKSIGITKQAVNKQKYRIFNKLKKFLEM
jgi:RNA polymerase sigma factor (sigma-70 family)